MVEKEKKGSRRVYTLTALAGVMLVACAAGSAAAQEMAERYPPRDDDRRPTDGWAPTLRRPVTAAARERLALEVDWADNETGEAVVTFGVPFPRGALADAAGIRVVEAGGQPAPAAFRVVATWDNPNGPVRWALGHARLARGRDYFLEYGSAIDAYHGRALEVSESAERVVVDTGPARFALSRTVPSVVESVTLAGGDEVVSAGCSAGELPVVADAAGNRYYARGACDGLTIEVVEAGPARAAVRRQGWYHDAAGNRFCQFITWTYFYAGETGIRHDHTLVVAFDSHAHQVREITLPVPLVLGKDTRAAFAADGSPGGSPVEEPASDGPFYLVQSAHDAWTLSGRRGELAAGARAGGWFGLFDGARGAYAGLTDFWQQYPAAFAADGDTLRVHLWPPSGVEPLDLRPSAQLGDLYPGKHVFHGRWYRDGLDEMTQAYGVGKTHNLYFEFFAGAGREAARRRIRARTNAPVLALPDPAWVCASGVLFGRVHPRDPARFPEIETLVDGIVDFYYDQRANSEQYGWIHFGDVYNTGSLWRRWASMFYGIPNLMPRLYLRSGRRDAWDFHRVNTRHITDLDICHLDSEEFGKWRGGRYGGDGCIAHYAAEQYAVGCDTHVEFMLMDYYINGNLRTREVADYYLRAHASRRDVERPMVSYDTRHTGGALRLFSEAYQATWDPQYLSIMRQVADQLYQAREELDATRMDDVYMNPGKILYYQLTGDERMRELFLNDMDILAERRNVHVRSDGRAATMSGLAHAYWFTGDEKYLPFLHWQLALPLERGLGRIGGPRGAGNAPHGSQLPEVMAVLAQVGELPAPLGPAAPETETRPLALRGDGPFYFHQPEDGEFSVTFEVNLYEARVRAFPAWQEWLARLPADEQPGLAVFDPSGAEIRRVALTPENTRRSLKLDFPADGKTGTYAFVPVSPAAPISVRPAQSTLEKRVAHVSENTWLSGAIARLIRQRSFHFTVPAGTGRFQLELKTSRLRGRVHYAVRDAAGAVVATNVWEVGANPRNDWETIVLKADAPKADEAWSITLNGAYETWLRFTGVPGYVASSPEDLFVPDPARRRPEPARETPGGEGAVRYVEAGLPWGGRAAWLARPVTLDAPVGEAGIVDEHRGTVEFWVRTGDAPANLANRSLLDAGGVGLSRRLNFGTYVTLGGSSQRFFILPPDRWTHLAVTWQPSDEPDADLHVRLFADGVEVAGTDIGASGTPHRTVTSDWPGRRLTVPAGNYVSNLRVSGTVRYETDFDRPTAPFEPDGETRVRVPFDGGGIAWRFGDAVDLGEGASKKSEE